VIDVSVSPERLTHGLRSPLTVTLLNESIGVCTNIVLRLNFPPEVGMGRGRDRIELERLEPGAQRSYPFVVRPGSAGTVAITSDNFSYSDGLGVTHRREDLHIPLVVEPATEKTILKATHPGRDSSTEDGDLRTWIRELEETREVLVMHYSKLIKRMRDEMIHGIGISLPLRHELEATRREMTGLDIQLNRAKERLAGGKVGDRERVVHAATHDVFICHATEDKAGVARPLAVALGERGWKVWLDETELQIGDSLRQRIDEGIRLSRYGVVILSPDFFAKRWTKYELDGLTDRELSSGGVVILPVWHKLSHDEVASWSSTLAGKVAAHTGGGIEAVADKIVRRLEGV
jgi:hypothetical protein